ncbi:MAG: TonB family protein [Opitutae bacterium]|nr:TonB family protein [Opitutae bacterium]
METTLYLRHTKPARKLAWPKESLPPGGPVKNPGNWRYYGLPKLPRISWVAIVLSAGVHAWFLLGFNAPKPVKRHVVADEPLVEMMAMPPLEPEKDDMPKELSDESEAAPSVDVPMLADVPSAVDLNVAFVQPLDVRPNVQSNLGAAKLTSIPVNIAHGPRTSGGLKDIFNLSQLDRVPEPISQTAPRFPADLKRDVMSAKVVVEFIVDSDGYVRDPFIVSTSHAGFNEAAIEGVNRWRFRPGIKTGRKVNTRMRVPILFEVNDSDR